MKIKPLGFSLKLRDENDLEKMKTYTVFNRFENYDLFRHKNSYLFLDAVNLRLYTVKTKWDLLDYEKFKDLVNLYKFFYYN